MEKIHLKYYNDQEYKEPIECDFGPAWKMLWEGGFYALQKKDTNRMLILALIHICDITLSLIIAPPPLSIVMAILFTLFVNFLFALNYNMIVIEAYIREGYLPMDTHSSEKLIEKGIYFKLQ